MPFPTEVRALGLRFHPMNKEKLLGEVFRERAPGTRMVLASANLHGLYVTHIDPDYDRLLQDPQTLVIVDGMPIIWLLKALGHNVDRSQRTTWVDWFGDTMALAAKTGRSIFVLGHTDEVMAAGLARARALWPSLRIDGLSGFFDMTPGSADSDRVVAAINAARPDFLVIGMGMPRQERFVKLFGHRLNVPMIGLGGAAFAYFAGFEPTPPRWMGRWGLEWLHRLGADPRRMAYRYLVEPAMLAYHLSKRAIRHRRHPKP